jgi:pimeloyl-ACP methyl ester carboxylesterase
MKPIFEHYDGVRPVYSLDLPGFGFSERSDREYSPDLYTRAILDFLRDEVQDVADVIAFSLSSEFAARAALQEPGFFRSLTLISPTGFTPRQQKRSSQSAAENDATDSLYGFFSNPLWSQAFYDLLVIRPSLRLFLQRNFVGEVNEGLIDYAYITTHQPGARYAPLYFVSGKLFSTTVFEQVYKNLTVPTMVLYDKDPNITFDKLPEILAANDSWRARRIPNTLGLPHFEKMNEVAAALDSFWDDV